MFKKILLLLIIVFSLSNTIDAQEKIEWLSFEEAVKKNEKEPKKFLIDMWTTWCGWCKKMDATTFGNPKIAKIVNEHYYAVKFNAESKDTMIIGGRTFVNEFPNKKRHPHQIAITLMQGKMSYPTIVYLDENVNLIQSIPGYHSPKDIEPILEYFGDNAFKTQDWPEFQKTFKSSFKSKEEAPSSIN